MHRVLAALLAVSSSAAIVHAQAAPPAATTPPLTLARALELAHAISPDVDAATAGVRAAKAGRQIAGLHPNPSVNADFENVGGARAYDTIEAPKQTVSLALPVELGGKRSARIGIAGAQAERAGIDQAVADADLRLAVTRTYIEALAAERRLAEARQQETIASDAAHAAHVRVTSGRASPLEEQRADVLRVNAQAAAERAARLVDLAHANLARRIGQRISEPLDSAWFERVDSYGPQRLLPGTRTLATAAARADEAAAAAQVRLAQSQRIPDVTLSAGARRLPINNDVAAVFGISIPLPLFNSGSAAVAQASAQRERAEAQGRAVRRDNDQAIAEAEADVANSAASARAAIGPVLAAAQEAARIARIGYAEGKFGQLDLLDAERTLAETHAAATDALAAYHEAQAQLDRLTATLVKD